MATAPYEPGDADTILDDFGIDVAIDDVTVKGLIDSAVQFQTREGIPIASGTHVVSVKRGALGALADLPMDSEIEVDGDAYVYRGPVDGLVGIFDRFWVADDQ